jgi:hypothetical protein
MKLRVLFNQLFKKENQEPYNDLNLFSASSFSASKRRETMRRTKKSKKTAMEY